MEQLLFQASWLLAREVFQVLELPRFQFNAPAREFSIRFRDYPHLPPDSAEAKVEVVGYLLRPVPKRIADVLRGEAEALRWLNESHDYHRFVDELALRITQETTTALGMVSWRGGIISAAAVLDPPTILRFAEGDPLLGDDDIDLPREVPEVPISLRFFKHLEVPRPTVEASEFSEMLASDGAQPVAHELLREAWSNVFSQPRAACLMSAVAVETGLAALIADLHPEADWVKKSGRTPRFMDLWAKLGPGLNARKGFEGEVRAPTLETTDRVTRWMKEKRDYLAHGRRVEVTTKEVLEFLDLARSLLYLFDYYRGEEWARFFIPNDVVEGAQPLD